MGYNPGGGLSLLQTANNSPVLLTNGAAAVNTTLKLAAGINYLAGTGTGPASELDLYDLTDPAQAVLLYTAPIPNAVGGRVANANVVGQVIFGVNILTGTNYIFALDANNGLAAYVLSGGTVPPPTFSQQPPDLRMIETSTNSLQAIADQIVNFNWFKGTNPPVSAGSTSNSLVISHASTANSGDYFCIISNQFGMATSRLAHVSVGLTNDNYTLSQRWLSPNFGPSGPTNYVSSDGGANTPNERAFAYNSASNQIIVVRCPPASIAYHLYVVNADTGAFLYEMNTNGIVHEGLSEVSGSNPIDLVGAAGADDGNIYVCNESPNSSGGQNSDVTKMWHLYRWTNSAPTTPAVSVFAGDPAFLPNSQNERWGDVMTVRGTGTNTEIFVNTQSGTYAAVLKPTDASLNTFTNYWFLDSGGAGGIGRGVQFGTNVTVYEKRKGNPLIFSSYDTNLNSSVGLFESPSSSTLGGVFVDAAHNLAVGVDFVGSVGATPDAVSVYDITVPTAPMFIKSYNFGNNQVANANAICETIVYGNRGWALDGNNGMLAFYIVPPVNSMKLNIVNSGSNVNLSWGNAQAILQGSSSLNPQNWVDLAGPGVTNSVQPASGTTLYRLIQRL
jgi:hypothetical protein